MRSILISNAHLQGFGGSELVSVELAEFYASKGWRVVLCAPLVGDPLVRTINKAVHVTAKMPDLDGWDIVWDHHGVLINHLPPDPKRITVCNHMSSYVALEFPKYMPSKATRIFANSQETVDVMSRTYAHRAELFQNPAPSEFDMAFSGEKSYGLFISNHRPANLTKAASVLGVNTYVIGQSDVQKRVEPRDFRGAAFVVCNGKSVQYALRAGCPVFLYDHFGGPGWITDENFRQCEYYNFSGRGFDEPKDVLESLSLWPLMKPVSRDLVNWRFKLEEWLYLKELI